MAQLRERAGISVRSVAACLLLIAAGLKYLHLATTPLLPDEPAGQRWLWIAQIELETFWGVWLLVGFWSRVARLSSASLFAIFALVSAYRGVLGYESCGCFGEFPINPWLMFAVDLLFAAAFLLIRTKPEPRRMRIDSSPLRLAIGLVGCSLLAIPIIFFPTGRRLATIAEDGTISGNEHVVLLDPSQWLGKRFPLVKHLELGPSFAHGRWHLLFIRSGCPNCEEALRQLLARSPLKNSADDANWALVALPPAAENAASLALPPQAKIPLIRLDGEKTWIAKVPFTVTLAGGIVVGWTPDIAQQT